VHPTDDRTAVNHVEHREGDMYAVVATGTRPLDPLAARLAAQGRGGYLAVVTNATGELVIRCPVEPEESDQPVE
jgi:hypothetical protein